MSTVFSSILISLFSFTAHFLCNNSSSHSEELTNNTPIVTLPLQSTTSSKHQLHDSTRSNSQSQLDKLDLLYSLFIANNLCNSVDGSMMHAALVHHQFNLLRNNDMEIDGTPALDPNEFVSFAAQLNTETTQFATKKARLARTFSNGQPKVAAKCEKDNTSSEGCDSFEEGKSNSFALPVNESACPYKNHPIHAACTCACCIELRKAYFNLQFVAELFHVDANCEQLEHRFMRARKATAISKVSQTQFCNALINTQGPFNDAVRKSNALNQLYKSKIAQIFVAGMFGSGVILEQVKHVIHSNKVVSCLYYAWNWILNDSSIRNETLDVWDFYGFWKSKGQYVQELGKGQLEVMVRYLVRFEAKYRKMFVDFCNAYLDEYASAALNEELSEGHLVEMICNFSLPSSYLTKAKIVGVYMNNALMLMEKEELLHSTYPKTYNESLRCVVEMYVEAVLFNRAIYSSLFSHFFAPVKKTKEAMRKEDSATDLMLVPWKIDADSELYITRQSILYVIATSPIVSYQRKPSLSLERLLIAMSTVLFDLERIAEFLDFLCVFKTQPPLQTNRKHSRAENHQFRLFYDYISLLQDTTSIITSALIHEMPDCNAKFLSSIEDPLVLAEVLLRCTLSSETIAIMKSLITPITPVLESFYSRPWLGIIPPDDYLQPTELNRYSVRMLWLFDEINRQILQPVSYSIPVHSADRFELGSICELVQEMLHSKRSNVVVLNYYLNFEEKGSTFPTNGAECIQTMTDRKFITGIVAYLAQLIGITPLHSAAGSTQAHPISLQSLYKALEQIIAGKFFTFQNDVYAFFEVVLQHLLSIQYSGKLYSTVFYYTTIRVVNYKEIIENVVKLKDFQTGREKSSIIWIFNELRKRNRSLLHSMLLAESAKYKQIFPLLVKIHSLATSNSPLESKTIRTMGQVVSVLGESIEIWSSIVSIYNAFYFEKESILTILFERDGAVSEDQSLATALPELVKSKLAVSEMLRRLCAVEGKDGSKIDKTLFPMYLRHIFTHFEDISLLALQSTSKGKPGNSARKQQQTKGIFSTTTNSIANTIFGKGNGSGKSNFRGNKANVQQGKTLLGPSIKSLQDFVRFANDDKLSPALIDAVQSLLRNVNVSEQHLLLEALSIHPE